MIRCRGIANRQAGLTLIEVIAALAVTAMLMAALMGTLTMSVRGVSHTRETLRRTRLACGIERTLRADLRTACTAGEPGIPSFVGRDPSTAGDSIVLLEFFSTHSLATSAEVSPSGLVRVEYILAQSELLPDTWELRRRETPYTVGRIPQTTSRPSELLADGLAGVKPSFYDGARWLEEWRRDHVPSAVRLEFTLPAEGDHPAQQISLTFRPVADADALP